MWRISVYDMWKVLYTGFPQTLVFGKTRGVKMEITLMNVEWTYFFLISLACFAIAILFSQKLGLNELRTIPRLEVLEEVVKSCSERGRPILFSYGGMNPASTMESVLLASANVLMMRTAKTCGDLGIPLYTTALHAQTFLMMTDSVRQGYLASSHPEAFRDENNYYTTDGIVGTYTNVSQAVQHNVGTYVQIGYLHMCSNVCVLEAVRRIGGTSWTMENAIDTQALGLVFADYTLLGEEQVAAGAMIKKDPLETAGIIGGDFAKLALIGLLIIYIVRQGLKI